MHYQYKWDCKTYTVLVSLENTKFQLESKGTEACALTEAEKLKISKPKQSRALQVYILNKNRGGGGRIKPTTKGKHFKIIENAKGKKRIREKRENIECFINFNKKGKKKMFTKNKRVQKALS